MIRTFIKFLPVSILLATLAACGGGGSGGDGGDVEVYLLNKSLEASIVVVDMKGAKVRGAGGREESFVRPGEVMESSVDDIGAVELKAYSFRRIVLG